MAGRNSQTNERADLFRELFDQVPIGLYRTTPAGKVIDVNPALVQMLGYPDRETLLSEAAEAVYLRLDFDRFLGVFRITMPRGLSFRLLKGRFRCRGGATLVMHVPFSV